MGRREHIFHLGLRKRCKDEEDLVFTQVVNKLEALGIDREEFPDDFISQVIWRTKVTMLDLMHRCDMPCRVVPTWIEIVCIYLQQVYALKKDLEDDSGSAEDEETSEGSVGDIKRVRRFTLGDLTVEGYATAASGVSAGRKAMLNAPLPSLNDTILNFAHIFCINKRFLF